jgi:hypothetical protein
MHYPRHTCIWSSTSDFYSTYILHVNCSDIHRRTALADLRCPSVAGAAAAAGVGATYWLQRLCGPFSQDPAVLLLLLQVPAST